MCLGDLKIKLVGYSDPVGQPRSIPRLETDYSNSPEHFTLPHNTVFTIQDDHLVATYNGSTHALGRDVIYLISP